MALPGALWWPIVWGQATGSHSGALAPLALRRWFSSLTLSSPAAVPSLFGLWIWLFGLAALLVLAAWLQGPLPALRQICDLPGHAALLSAALERLRRTGRMLALTIGATVLVWTVGQTLRFNAPQGRDDLLLLTKARSLGELAFEQGTLAALTPMRDLFGLGDNMLLLLLATAVLFRAATEDSDHLRSLSLKARHGGGSVGVAPAPGWTKLIWAAVALYLLYRLVARVFGEWDLPPGGFVVIEAMVIPFLMVLSDAVLLAWLLVELRSVSLGAAGVATDPVEPRTVASLLPAAMVACLLALPGRYLAAAVLLGWTYAPALGGLLRWLMNGGLVELQGVALATLGLAGALAWSRGTVRGAIRGYRRMLAAGGGRLVVLLATAGLAAGCGSALAYLLVLALPASTWVLAAADGYAHYATLPVGLISLAALVELGERTLPPAILTTTTSVAEVAVKLNADTAVSRFSAPLREPSATVSEEPVA